MSVNEAPSQPTTAAHLRTELVVDALQMARLRRCPDGTVAHSDHGRRYTSWVFGQRLRHAGLLGSMGTVGDALDNAVAESFFASLQCELLDRSTARPGRPRPGSLRPSSNGSKPSTTRPAATPPSATSAPSTTKPLTPHDYPHPTRPSSGGNSSSCRPLERVRTHRNTDKGGTYRWYYDYRLPERLGSGVETVRIHANDDAAARKFNRAENVRQIPPGDPDFEVLYRRRNDAESINRHLDDTLWLGRAHAVGHRRQLLNLITYALGVNAISMLVRRRIAEPPNA